MRVQFFEDDESEAAREGGHWVVSGVISTQRRAGMTLIVMRRARRTDEGRRGENALLWDRS